MNKAIQITQEEMTNPEVCTLVANINLYQAEISRLLMRQQNDRDLLLDRLVELRTPEQAVAVT